MPWSVNLRSWTALRGGKRMCVRKAITVALLIEVHPQFHVDCGPHTDTLDHLSRTECPVVSRSCFAFSLFLFPCSLFLINQEGSTIATPFCCKVAMTFSVALI